MMYTRRELERRFPDLERFPERYLVSVIAQGNGHQLPPVGGFAYAIDDDNFYVGPLPNHPSCRSDAEPRKIPIPITDIRQIRSADLIAD